MTWREGLKSHVTITVPAFARDWKTLKINAIAESTPHLALIRNNASISTMIASLPDHCQDQKLLRHPQGCCFLCQLVTSAPSWEAELNSASAQ
jgi:hypothetical protein